ncbi:MAG: type II toxin-antitoxin system RelE/ParE family toxin [Spongiibacteraceae bacterium]|nr:type II toxin-antitoxin system RelE/ParE family toxin [Spongiibacteraceae bacterium]
MLPVRWTEPALADLMESQAYYEQVNPKAAEVLAQRVWDASQGLGDNPGIGRTGDVEGTQEWVVQKSPYILVYWVRSDYVEMLHVYHDRQDWQSA